MNIAIHPLSIASACDHYTRVIMGGSKLPTNSPVYGLLFGSVINDNTFSILESTDAIYDVSNDGTVSSLLQAQVEKKISLWTAVYTDYRLLGWYAFGDEVAIEHMTIHNQILEFNDKSIFLLMNKTLSDELNAMPLSIYIKEIHNNNEIFVTIPFKIETSQVEKIALDHVMKSVPTEGISSAEVNNLAILQSLKIMDNKVEIIIDILSKIRDGSIPIDNYLLRKASKICKLLNASKEDTQYNKLFDEEINKSMADDLIIGYLSTVTNVNTNMKDLSDVCQLVFGDRNLMGSSKW